MNVSLSIEIDSGNAAFDDGCAHSETARILKDITKEIENEYEKIDMALFDSNGNKVGRLLFSCEREEECDVDTYEDQ